jgi:hypothetical protein
MNLKDYIYEWISSGKAVRSYDGSGSAYTEFPAKRTDYWAIRNWLDDNGFDTVGYSVGPNIIPSILLNKQVSDLLSKWISDGKKVYTMGTYDYNDGETKYILFYDGVKMYRIFTCPMKELPSGLEPVSYFDHRKAKPGNIQPKDFKYTSMKEIQRHFS